MLHLTSLLLLPAVVLGRVLTYQDTPPDQITIASVQHSGNGCPQGTVSTTISPDRTVITVGFDGFQTYIGPGTSIMDRSKNCQLHLTLNYPGGYRFAIADSTYHGYAQLDDGVTGTFFSTYYFSSDAANTCTTQTSIQGGGVWAAGQVYTKEDLVPAANSVSSPCGGSSAILNLNNRIALSSSNPQASGMITDDDRTVALTQQIHIDWRRC
jgi:hypothetical protein